MNLVLPFRKTYKNGVGGPVSEDCLYANVFTNQYCLEHVCFLNSYIQDSLYYFPEKLLSNVNHTWWTIRHRISLSV